MITVGSVAVDIVPSAARFATDLRRDILPDADRVGREVGDVIAEQVTKGIREGVQRGLDSGRAQAVDKGAATGGAFADGFKARVEAALKALPDVKIDADSTEADRKIAELRARLLELHDTRVGVDIDAGAAMLKIDRIKLELDELAARSPNIDVKVNTLAASAKLALLRLELDRTKLSEDEVAGGGAGLLSLPAAAGAARLATVGIGVAGAGALGTLLIPAVAAATAAVVGLAQAGAAVGLGLGVGLLALKPVFGGVTALNAQKNLPANASKAEKATAQKAVDEAMAGMSAAGQQFTRFIVGLGDPLAKLSRAAQTGFLPGLEKGIKALLPYLPGMTRFVGELATVMGRLFTEAGRALAAPFWHDFFDFIAKNAPGWLSTFALTVGYLAEAAAGLFKAMAPLGELFGKELLGWAKSFATWSTTLSTNKGFQSFVAFLIANAPVFTQAVGHIVLVVWDIVKALAPAAAAIARFVASLSPQALAGVILGISAVWAVFFPGPKIIFIALSALIAVITDLWNHNKTFRAVVTEVWTAVSTFIANAWKNVIHPALDAIGGFITNTLVPAFQAFGHWVSVTWSTVIYPAIKAMWGWFKDQIMPTILDLWHNVVVPAFHTIGQVIQVTWQNIIEPALRALWWFIKTVLAPVISWLAVNVVGPEFRAIGAIITFAWQHLIKPILDAFVYAVRGFPGVFDSVKAAIKSVWDGLLDVVAGPINDVLNFVRKYFIGPLNTMLAAVGISWRIPFPGNIVSPSENRRIAAAAGVHGASYAGGGTVDGYSPHDKADNIPAWLTAGEYVLPVAAVRAIRAITGGEGYLDQLRAGKVPAFADGGLVENVGSFFSRVGGAIGNVASNVGGFLGDVASFLANPVDGIKHLIGNVMHGLGNNLWVQTIGAVLGKFAGGAADFLGGLLGGGGGGPVGTINAGVTVMQGRRLDTDTAHRIQAASAYSHLPFTIIQGSWSNNPLSMGTHAGSGAADLWSRASWSGGVAALRHEGLYAMFRNWPGNQHIHVINPHVAGLSPQALSQVHRAAANNGIFGAGGPVLVRDHGGPIPPGTWTVHNGTGDTEWVAPPGRGNGDTHYWQVDIDPSSLAGLRAVEDFVDHARQRARQVTGAHKPSTGVGGRS